MSAMSLYLTDGEHPEVSDRPAIEARVKGMTGPFWLSMTGPSEEDLAWLGKHWGFHPLTLEDCRTYNPRPKLEEYTGYLFLVLHEASLGTEEMRARDIQVYFSNDYLITVQRDESRVLGNISQRRDELSRGTDFLLYRIFNHLTEDYFDLIGRIDERIESVEEEVIWRPGRQMLHLIFVLRQDLTALLRIAGPLREILHQIADRDYPFVKPEHQLYFRDIYNSLIFVHEMVETQRDLTSGALEAYLSSISNNLNEVMKRLTLIATVFMPLTFVVGLWGMNFQLLPFDSSVVMWGTMVVIILLPLAMLGWFRAKGWV